MRKAERGQTALGVSSRVSGSASKISLLIPYCSHSRQETREGQQRPINKDYYYIDFHATIDALKYRIFRLTNQVKDMYKPSTEKKDYRCPKCRAEWTELEVLDKFSAEGFLCHRCDGVLERDDVSAADKGGHEKQSRLMSQLESLLKLMPQIDSQIIPNNDFETAFSVAIPVLRNEDINPVRKSEAIESTNSRPTAVKGLTQVAAAPLEVSLTTSSASAAAEREAEAQRKANLAAQNALPVWHTQSTVTGEATALGNKERDRLTNGATLGLLKDEDEEKKEADVTNDDLAAYYRQLQEEKEKEAREDREADESSGEDEEDEFEDVGIEASGLATPASSFSVAANGAKTDPVNGRLFKHENDSGSSAPSTGISTPAGSFAAAGDEDGPSKAKRAKLEQTNGIVAALAASPKADKDSDEDDEAEFEDAL